VICDAPTAPQYINYKTTIIAAIQLYI
jgi:hypothetical protein